MAIAEFQHVGFIRCVGERSEAVIVHEFRAVAVLASGERHFRPERRYRLETGEKVDRDDESTFRVATTGYRLSRRDGGAA